MANKEEMLMELIASQLQNVDEGPANAIEQEMMGEGVFEGELYFSPQMPKGDPEDWPFEYDEEMTSTLRSADKVDGDSLKVIQQQLIDMELLEPGQDDSFFGDKTSGAIRRYLLNTQKPLFKDVPSPTDDPGSIFHNYDKPKGYTTG